MERARTLDEKSNPHASTKLGFVESAAAHKAAKRSGYYPQYLGRYHFNLDHSPPPAGYSWARAFPGICTTHIESTQNWSDVLPIYAGLESLSIEGHQVGRAEC
jgi:hypothetical protein